MKKTFLLLIAMCVCTLSNATFYVAPTAAGNADGSSWDNAFGTIQEAITAAEAAKAAAITAAGTEATATTGAQEVWVKAGTYMLTATVSVKQLISVYGGFAGTETAISQRVKGTNRWDYTNATILDGGWNGVALSTVGVRVMEFTGADVTSSTVVDGFTIQHGNANASSVGVSSGGGAYIASGMKLYNCKVINNYAGTATANSAGGAGINLSVAVTNTENLVSGCYISGNTSECANATHKSKGINCGAFSATSITKSIIEYCLFENQEDPIHVQVTAATASTTTTAGVYNSTFTFNSNILRDCFSANSPVMIRLTGQARFINNLVYNCSALNTGSTANAQILVIQGNIKAINNTIVNNTGSCGLSGNTTGGDKPDAKNNIIWGNKNILGGDVAIINPSNLNITNNAAFPVISSLVSNSNTNNVSLVDNTNSSIKFTSPTSFSGRPTTTAQTTEMQSANWSLLTGSAAISIGDNTAFPSDLAQSDIIGHVRVGGTIEAGAYEFETSAATSVKTTSLNASSDIATSKNGIVVKADCYVQVYTFSGKTVFSAKTESGQLIALPTGAYIVKSISKNGTNATKIIL